MSVFNEHGHLRWNAQVPVELRLDVCVCGNVDRMGFSRGFPEKGERDVWWYCRTCNKPSRYYAIYECENCDSLFVPSPTDDLPLSQTLGVCNDCL